jgi:uncharacterized membrane protein YphA (DoxX/SURF4 family)
MHSIALRPSGALLLRATLGIAFLARSLYLKLFVFTRDRTVRFQSLGLPGLLAWAVQLIEMGGVAHALADDEAAS